MRFLKHLLLIASFTALFMILPGANAITCESCHSSSGADGDYVYRDPIIKLVHDPFFSPGSSFNVKLVIIPQNDYDMWSISGDLSFSGTHISLGSSKSMEGEVLADGRAVVEWEFNALTEGSSDIDVSMEYKVHFRHDSGGNKDIGTYYDSISTTVHVSDLSLSISPGSVILTEVGETSRITLSASKDITGISVDVPSSLKDSINVTVPDTELSSGDSTSITITLMNRSNVEDDIVLRWTEESSEKEASITVSLVKLVSESGGRNIFLVIGQITGISAAVLLLIGYFSGGTGFMKKYANKIFKTASKRVKFHCKLSYLIMELAVFHLVVLIYGPYREVIFDWEVVLGWLAMLIMIVIAVNGIFQKRFIIRFGYQNWRRIHAWGTYITTGLVIIHLVTYGSHFSWLREIIGMQ